MMGAVSTFHDLRAMLAHVPCVIEALVNGNEPPDSAQVLSEPAETLPEVPVESGPSEARNNVFVQIAPGNDQVAL